MPSMRGVVPEVGSAGNAPECWRSDSDHAPFSVPDSGRDAGFGGPDPARRVVRLACAQRSEFGFFYLFKKRRSSRRVVEKGRRERPRLEDPCSGEKIEDPGPDLPRGPKVASRSVSSLHVAVGSELVRWCRLRAHFHRGWSMSAFAAFIPGGGAATIPEDKQSNAA